MEFIISNLHLELHSRFLETVFDLISQRFAIFSTLISGYLTLISGKGTNCFRLIEHPSILKPELTSRAELDEG